MSLSAASFFRYYIFHPVDAPRAGQRWMALLTSIALGILSAGFVHMVCAALYQRKFAPIEVRSYLDRKASAVFDEAVKGKDQAGEKKSALEIEEMVDGGQKVDAWIGVIRDGAKKNDRDFQFLLGRLYKNGEGLEQSDESAFLWFRQAAKQGHVKAQYFLATHYHSGKGVDKSLEKAAKWYLRAADGGDVHAQFSIGSMFQHGKGVDASLPDAAKWYKKAALKGNDKAMNNLGVMYYYGQGVKESYERAIYWLKKATSLGNQSALQNLEDILEAQNRKEAEF